jgi:DNA-binding LytR/AlgR family response regulator
MIKAIIIEDEAPARKKLTGFLEKVSETVEVVKTLETVEETFTYLQENPAVDVIFSDIELLDGNVFEVFNALKIQAPIIFTTAYNQFWMNAFETNGIEYLLKPYSFPRFQKAWNKFMQFQYNASGNPTDILKKLDSYFQNIGETKTEYKLYLPIKSNTSIYFLQISEIAYFQASYGVLFAFDTNLKRHTLSQNSLKELEEILNPNQFFKINRSELVNRSFVERIERYSKNAVSIQVKTHTLKTSQNTTAAFNDWMGI